MEEQACVPSKICAIFAIFAEKQIVSSKSDKPLAYAQNKQQFDWLHVLKQRPQASPEQFEKFEITFQKVKKAKFFSPSTKNRARLQGFAEIV